MFKKKRGWVSEHAIQSRNHCSQAGELSIQLRYFLSDWEGKNCFWQLLIFFFFLLCTIWLFFFYYFFLNQLKLCLPLLQLVLLLKLTGCYWYPRQDQWHFSLLQLRDKLIFVACACMWDDKGAKHGLGFAWNSIQRLIKQKKQEATWWHSFVFYLRLWEEHLTLQQVKCLLCW